ncbi:hypothetical protein bmyco0002_23210 [Bacillus pseudomycoides]|nr:hypothetical protein bmyco0002_23210 [Bacillus pseudomycoides]
MNKLAAINPIGNFGNKNVCGVKNKVYSGECPNNRTDF